MAIKKQYVQRPALVAILVVSVSLPGCAPARPYYTVEISQDSATIVVYTQDGNDYSIDIALPSNSRRANLSTKRTYPDLDLVIEGKYSYERPKLTVEYVKVNGQQIPRHGVTDE